MENKTKKSRTARLLESVPDVSYRSADEQVGLGVIMIDIDRVKTVLERTPRFKTRVFTQLEQEFCDKKATPYIHYATRFAAKQAVLKALETDFGGGFDPRDIEIKRSVKGRPHVNLRGRAQQRAKDLGVTELPLSLSYTHTQAIACAMGITQAAAAPVEKVDPMEELSKQFKELRGMLDNLDATEAGTTERKE